MPAPATGLCRGLFGGQAHQRREGLAHNPRMPVMPPDLPLLAAVLPAPLTCGDRGEFMHPPADGAGPLSSWQAVSRRHSPTPRAAIATARPIADG